jgi:hypothetical protein
MHSQQMASIALSAMGLIDYLGYRTIFTHVMFDVLFPRCLLGGGGGQGSSKSGGQWQKSRHNSQWAQKNGFDHDPLLGQTLSPSLKQKREYHCHYLP